MGNIQNKDKYGRYFRHHNNLKIFSWRNPHGYHSTAMRNSMQFAYNLWYYGAERAECAYSYLSGHKEPENLKHTFLGFSIYPGIKVFYKNKEEWLLKAIVGHENLPYSGGMCDSWMQWSAHFKKNNWKYKKHTEMKFALEVECYLNKLNRDFPQK